MEIIIGLAIGLVVGIAAGYVINRFFLKAANTRMIETAKVKAESVIKEAELRGENIKQERINQSNEKYQQLKSKFENNAKKEKEKLDVRHNKLKQREQSIQSKEDKLRKESNEVKNQQRDPRSFPSLLLACGAASPTLPASSQ
ncbi:MAG: Rnase Y domain-containing protein [Bacteroidota bacterium]